ncbi:amidohydrolase, partial [Streptomyces sp. SID11233]|nr:amidohydrolase [Streptomyces sp. SID11233]
IAAAGVLAVPAAAQAAPSTADAKEKIALTNVRVFDGTSLTSPRTVVIENGRIGLTALGARKIDGGGATLLPGLIDAHIHLQDLSTLQQLASYGVTTALD